MLIFPSTDYSAAIGFGGNRLDRLSERRDDEAFVASVRENPDARFILLSGERLLLRDGAALHPRDEAAALGARADDAVFLGLDETGPVFGAHIEPPDGVADVSGTNTRPGTSEGTGGRGAKGLVLCALRPLANDGTLPPAVLGAVGQARGVLGWHQRHRFCANCGAATVMGHAGMRRDCPSCGANHFPRTDPVVIMLAVDGDKCLLGRQHRFADGVYSCLAGFMEPGETVEAAVRREIWEESGIRTDCVAYHASQPWPFPSSLMIGCFANATSTDIDPQDPELEDVRWFDRADIGPMLDRTHPHYSSPPGIAIAHHLLRAYADHGAPQMVAPDALPDAAAGADGAGRVAAAQR